MIIDWVFKAENQVNYTWRMTTYLHKASFPVHIEYFIFSMVTYKFSAINSRSDSPLTTV